MSSPAYEAFLLKVLIDRGARDRFLAAPLETARAQGLTDDEAAALAAIDRAGLLMAAESLRHKREGSSPRTRAAGPPFIGRLARWFRR